MGTLEQTTLVQRMYAALDNNDLAAVPEIFDPNWVNHDPSMPPMSGHEGARQLITILKTAFPDFRTEIVATVAEGDLVAARLIHTGTHGGEFMGIPPTGRQVIVTATGIFRVVAGRLVENRVIFDALGMLHQLGVIPEPATA